MQILNYKNGYLKKNIEKQFTWEYLFCQSNEHYALKFIKKLEGFKKEKYSFVIIWKTKNIILLFNLKNKTSHVSSAVWEGTCKN